MELPECSGCLRVYPRGTLYCTADGQALQLVPYELKPGSRIEPCILEVKLWETHHGALWQARREAPNPKKQAIQVFYPWVGRESIRSVVQSLRELGRLRRPSLLEMYDAGELLDGRAYLVLEALSGERLQSYLSRFRTLPFSEIVDIFSALCEGLQAAHEAGFVHKDLTPDSIFLLDSFFTTDRKKPFLKILDFCFSQLENRQNRVGKLKLDYVSPEGLLGQRVDLRADIYSLGALLFEMLCGQAPFSEETELSRRLQRKLTEPPPKVSRLVPDRNIPAEVDALLQRSLAVSASARPVSCAAFYDELVAAVGALRSEGRSELTPAEVFTAPSPDTIQPEIERLSQLRLLFPDAEVDASGASLLSWLEERLDEHLAALLPFTEEAAALPPAKVALSRSLPAALAHAKGLPGPNDSPVFVSWRKAIAASRRAMAAHLRAPEIAAQRTSSCEEAARLFRQAMLRPQDIQRSALFRAWADSPGSSPLGLIQGQLSYWYASLAGYPHPSPFTPLLALWERGVWPLFLGEAGFFVYVPVRRGESIAFDPEGSSALRPLLGECLATFQQKPALLPYLSFDAAEDPPQAPPQEKASRGILDFFRRLNIFK